MLKQSPEAVLIEQVFDATYYAWEYPDLGLSGTDALQHFLELGWREGRNPNPYFDTAGYLLTNADVADERINPYYHYLRYGLYEGRETMPAASPSVRTQLLFGYELRDWVARITPEFDRAFYAQQCRDPDLDGINPVAHFAYYGWRRGLSPARAFPLRNWLTQNPALSRFLVNPLIIQAEKAAGRFDDSAIRRSFSLEAARHAAHNTPPAHSPGVVLPTDPAPEAAAEAPEFIPTDAERAALQSGFSALYYLATYEDVAQAGFDPLAHYLRQGWREDRNPNPSFDAAYYAANNPDVRALGRPPFLHYLQAGQAEGRLPRAPGGYRRAIIEAAQTPQDRTRAYVDHAGDPMLQRQQIITALRAHQADHTGLLLACSHDCYVRFTGGMQIFLADEAANSQARGYLYLHLSPSTPKLHVLDDGADPPLRLTLNGQVLGLADLATVTAALQQVRAGFPAGRAFVLHSALGFSVAALAALCRAVDGSTAYLWLHDYATACLGYTLLRNDVAFCGAPPADSMACRVCIYGASRPALQDAMARLFAQTRFTVLAPSEAALTTWQAATNYPVAGAIVHPHWHLTPSPRRRPAGPAGRLRIAFLGQAVAAKGWPLFAALVQHFRGDSRFSFYHFVDTGRSPIDGVITIPTTVSPTDRGAAIRLLGEHRIDYVAMLSNWPETFAYVACEVIVAGALLLCLADSGNVRALAESTGCGQVFETAEALEAFLDTGAVAFLRTQRRKLPLFDYAATGTTATLLPQAGPE